MDRCNRCNQLKDKSEFVNSKGKKSPLCIKCRKDKNEQAKRYYRKWTSTDDERRKRLKRGRRNAALRRKYGISLETFEEMFAVQKGKCGICEQTLLTSSQKGWGGKREACVDHNHADGKVRGLLCRGCNLALSMIEDKDFQTKSNQYLSKFET